MANLDITGRFEGKYLCRRAGREGPRPEYLLHRSKTGADLRPDESREHSRFAEHGVKVNEPETS